MIFCHTCDKVRVYFPTTCDNDSRVSLWSSQRWAVMSCHPVLEFESTLVVVVVVMYVADIGSIFLSFLQSPNVRDAREQ